MGLMIKWVSCGAVVVLMFVSSGCARYERKPLNADVVERELTAPGADAIRVAASKLRHPMLEPMPIDLSKGLSPEEAGLVAVIVNPQLRAQRDQRGIAAAQLIQAGLLPNPQLTGGVD